MAHRPADQALTTVETCLSWADEMGHLGSRLHALDIALMLHHFRRDFDRVEALAAEVRAIALKYELDDYLAKVEIFEGWCQLQKGAVEEGADRLEAGLASMRLVGTREDFPVYFAMVAESRLRRGQVDEAAELLDEGLGVMADEGVAYWAAEIYRLSAECFSQAGGRQADQAEAQLEKAIEIAQSQDALALELRAKTALARRLQQRGEAAAARSLLGQLLERLQEGRGTRDLKTALALLETLESEASSGERQLV